MTKHGLLFALFLVLLFALSTFGDNAADEAALSLHRPVVDGAVNEGEYANMYHDELIGMMLRWQAVDDIMYIAMVAPGTGWVGLNFMPMDGTIHGDTVIGYVDVESQEAFMSDQVAPGDAHFPHFDDRQHGGETSFIEIAGTESDGVTVIEFSRALMTGEPTDAPFMDMGLMTMLSFHPTADDYVSYHSKWYNVVTINYISGEVMGAMDMSHTGSDEN
jgi:hypothetical protein